MYTTKEKGYSLIELLVYIALFAAISMIVIQSLLFVMKTYANARQYRSLQQNGELIMERLTREIRGASNVVDASSTFGTSPGVLALSGQDSGGTPYTASFSVSGGRVRLTFNGSASDISTSDVSVQDMVFHKITTATSDAVRVQLTLQTIKPPVVSATFYTTVVVRQ